MSCFAFVAWCGQYLHQQSCSNLRLQLDSISLFIARGRNRNQMGKKIISYYLGTFLYMAGEIDVSLYLGKFSQFQSFIGDKVFVCERLCTQCKWYYVVMIFNITHVWTKHVPYICQFFLTIQICDKDEVTLQLGTTANQFKAHFYCLLMFISGVFCAMSGKYSTRQFSYNWCKFGLIRNHLGTFWPSGVTECHIGPFWTKVEAVPFSLW